MFLIDEGSSVEPASCHSLKGGCEMACSNQHRVECDHALIERQDLEAVMTVSSLFVQLRESGIWCMMDRESVKEEVLS